MLIKFNERVYCAISSAIKSIAPWTYISGTSSGAGGSRQKTVAVLSRLEIPAEKEAQYTQQLNDFLEYVENLSTVPTDDIQPIAHVLPISNVFRDDVVKKNL